jgi:hypothetical protein
MDLLGLLAEEGRSTEEGLAALVEAMPDLVPRRTEAAQEEPAVVAGCLRRFVHDIVTTNPATKDSLASIQIFLIESPFGLVDWEALARDQRFCDLDWSHAGLTLMASG